MTRKDGTTIVVTSWQASVRTPRFSSDWIDILELEIHSEVHTEVHRLDTKSKTIAAGSFYLEPLAG
ncbi:MAG: hypothetical protein HC835_21620 [Oscillatoriales cyanobacterium RM2_1_1]|nr:hypothetical protein [Oscillatoriales cyanobacterium SM2_3_0]NJO47983.1 hypothetical protein [Oscillatoriales cyanobacterium RM2_1_1]